ncbi:MAG: hypothetical protein ACOYN0_13115 [Phycisphaerales bacterium]
MLSKIRTLPPPSPPAATAPVGKVQILVVTLPSGTQAKYILPREPGASFFLGSKQDIGVTIEDAGLRPRHLKFEMRETGVRVTEVGGRSDALFNGMPLEWPTDLPLDGEVNLRGATIRLSTTDDVRGCFKIEPAKPPGRLRSLAERLPRISSLPAIPRPGLPEWFLIVGSTVLVSVLVLIAFQA